MSYNNTHNKSKLIIASALAFSGFVLVALLMVGGKITSSDLFLLNKVVSLRTPLLNKVFTAITHCGDVVTMSALGLALLIIPKTRHKIGIPYTAAAMSSTFIYNILKILFARSRPDESLRLVEQFDFSFPSGHSMNCLVGYGLLIYLIRKYCGDRKTANILTVFLSSLIVSIGSSRVYLGVHYPSDVIGGWSLGLSVLFMALIILDRE